MKYAQLVAKAMESVEEFTEIANLFEMNKKEQLSAPVNLI